MMKNSLFEKEVLENWCEYRLKVGVEQFLARYVNGSFVYEWGVIKVEEVDDYVRIRGYERWNS